MSYLTIPEVESVVSDYFRRDPAELHVLGRAEPIAWIRGIVMALAVEFTAFNDTECARYYGLDRGVVRAARIRMKNRSDTSERDRRDVLHCRMHVEFLTQQSKQPTQADLHQTWLVLEGGVSSCDSEQIA